MFTKQFLIKYVFICIHYVVELIHVNLVYETWVQFWKYLKYNFTLHDNAWYRLYVGT